MKKLFIQTSNDGRVTWAVIAERKPSPWIDTGLTAFTRAEEREGFDSVMYWNGKAIVWHYEPSVPPQEPTEPTYEEPTPPTNEEISQMRQEAYEAECDKYQRAYLGYTLEGDTAKAESARKAYLRAKAEVRARLPYAEEAEEVHTIPLSRDDDLL